MIFDLKRRERPAGARVGIHGLAPNLAALMPDYDPNAFAQAVRTVPRLGIITQIGRGGSQQAAYLKRFLAFLCDCGAAPGASPSRRRPLARGAERGHRGKVRVAPSFARKALVVRIDEVRYAADLSNAFIAPPGDCPLVV